METFNKTAIVTGAGTGIGKVIAYELAKAGYDVAVHCNGSTDGANEVAEQIRTDFGRRAVVIQSNLAQLSGVDKLFDEFNKHFDRLDLFVNNAGVTKKSKFLETEEEMFDLIVNVPKNHTKRELTNGYKIRRGAIDHNIPLLTNARLAKAFIESFCAMKLEDIQITSWQEY